MQNRQDPKQLRSFALTVGGVFAIIGLWPALLYGLPHRFWAIAIAAFLIVLGLAVPRTLVPFYAAWMALGHVLGWINTRIILGIIFYGLVTPIGAIRRLMGKDSMERQLRPDLKSYRVLRTARPPSHLTRQY